VAISTIAGKPIFDWEGGVGLPVRFGPVHANTADYLARGGADDECGTRDAASAAEAEGAAGGGMMVALRGLFQKNGHA
jgi:hypothetical protein